MKPEAMNNVSFPENPITLRALCALQWALVKSILIMPMRGSNESQKKKSHSSQAYTLCQACLCLFSSPALPVFVPPYRTSPIPTSANSAPARDYHPKPSRNSTWVFVTSPREEIPEWEPVKRVGKSWRCGCGCERSAARV